VCAGEVLQLPDGLTALANDSPDVRRRDVHQDPLPRRLKQKRKEKKHAVRLKYQGSNCREESGESGERGERRERRGEERGEERGEREREIERDEGERTRGRGKERERKEERKRDKTTGER
jgi:hypothetical protein